MRDQVRCSEFANIFLEKFCYNAKLVPPVKNYRFTIVIFRAGGAFGAHAHNDHGFDYDGHDETNPHVWLDPGNARALVYKIEEALTKANPTMAGNFRMQMHDAH